MRFRPPFLRSRNALLETFRAGRLPLCVFALLLIAGIARFAALAQEGSTPASTPTPSLSVDEPIEDVPGEEPASGDPASEEPTSEETTSEETGEATTEEVPAPESNETPEPTTTPEPTPTVDPTPTPTTTPATTSIPSRPFGRTIVLMLGGVSWQDWLGLASQSSTSTPGLRRVVEEGALAAAFLPGEENILRYQNQQRDSISAFQNGTRNYSRNHPQNVFQNTLQYPRVSAAMLRAALILSSSELQVATRALPLEAARTLSLHELPAAKDSVSASARGTEEGEAAVVFARRTDRAPSSGNLVNLGWGALLHSNYQTRRDDEIKNEFLGALAENLHRAGAQTASLGSGDVSAEQGASIPLREWALLACDANGVADAGDVSNRLLARDKAAPFGVRANRKAMLQSLDAILKSGRTGLVSIEWGDTRRAAMYAPLCAPDVAEAHRQAALRSADAFVQELLARLQEPRDRLVVLALPDLDSVAAQWLPLSYWRPEKGGQGAFLEAAQNGEARGAVGLDNLFSRLVTPLAVESASTLPPSLDERGMPQSPSHRIGKLIALQSGLSRLDAARNFSHVLWCALFCLACVLTIPALLPQSRSPRLASMARTLWGAVMIFPWLLWLSGLCVETTWRFDDGSSEGMARWKLTGALLLVACLMWFLASATFSWFGSGRLQRIRIAVFWALLSIIGLWIGGFVLPWNALLRLAPSEISVPISRAGELWSLLLISATLLGIAGLTKGSSQSKAQNSVPDDDEDSALRIPDSTLPKRVLNLRPALIWVVALIALLYASSWGRNGMAALVAAVGGLAMCIRMWLESAPRGVRRRNRSLILIAVGVGVLLLWQRGALGEWNVVLENWWRSWRAAWQDEWWSIALFFLLLLVGALAFSPARESLRNHMAARYSLRAMLGAAALAALVAFLIHGPAAPVLLSTFTLGALAYEILGSRDSKM